MLSFTTAHVAVVALRVQGPGPRPRPYRVPWNVRIRGSDDPADRGARRASARSPPGCSVVVLHAEARTVGIAWMVVGHGRLLRSTAAARASTRAAHVQDRAPASARRTSRSSPTARRSCRSSAPTSSARALRSAAKLVGEDATSTRVYVLQVPRQLSLDAGLEEEEARGRSVLESARDRGRERRAARCAPADPHAQPGRRARRGGASGAAPRSSTWPPSTPRRPSSALGPDGGLPARASGPAGSWSRPTTAERAARGRDGAGRSWVPTPIVRSPSRTSTSKRACACRRRSRRAHAALRALVRRGDVLDAHLEADGRLPGRGARTRASRRCAPSSRSSRASRARVCRASRHVGQQALLDDELVDALEPRLRLTTSTGRRTRRSSGR